MKLYWKVLITAMLPLILVLGLGMFQVNRSLRLHEESVALENRLKVSLLRFRLSSFLNDMKKTAAILGASGDAARAVEGADSDYLTTWGKLFLDAGGMDKILFTDLDGMVLSRPHDPSRFGDSLRSHPAFQGAAGGRDVAAFYEIEGAFSIICAAPVKLYGDIPVGTVMVAAPVTPSLLSFFVSGTGLELLVEPEGHPAATSFAGACYRSFLHLDPELIHEGIPMKRVLVYFPDDRAMVPLTDLHSKLVLALGFFFVALPLGLFLMLRRHLRPYTRLMGSLIRLSDKDADLPGLRESLEEESGKSRHEVAAVTAAVASILKMLEEKIALLEWTSRTDALTQVSNRLHLDGVLQRVLQSSAKSGAPLSVLILDLDHFKEVNDTFGHQAGDGVLRKTAAILSGTVGQRGSVGRWGGEEFLVVLPGRGAEEALAVAEEIRSNVENGTFDITRYVTVSIGVAEALPGDTPGTLVRRADMGLYRAKAEGRNRTAPGEE
ncbi:diguanylate cyclase (GGDEF)-like protein [Aminivibrio pyruvatiphilus]|uniref:Diguanylate cyclase (GGDEF)-like protein n=1 Tax=Aminivibrio pyruvatiphilus TaxID=1005740 RepID=A0A4R8M6P2_9BACT|nr:diguanylate cyclase [Aminivibrio pyruvatiphilus]TDY60824.1 diguanylate cyclase (GGDEF)-like protein [Aminivibrio pyruvatiphilus]